ncbi:hypothetical protein ACFHWD_03840 [Clostridium sp. MT-14]|uniref:hypothetical protein n=1 Tax=Clostridium sp. MT-14 TaxID=3348360 RepID=UPI0035F268EF
MKYVNNSLTITEFKRQGNKRPVKMLFIKIGKYYMVVNDADIKRYVKNAKETLTTIERMNIPDYDKVFLVHEAIELVPECFEKTFNKYQNGNYHYRFDVNLILSKDEREKISEVLKNWKEGITGTYKERNGFIYNIYTNILYEDGEDQNWKDGSYKLLKTI